MIESCLAVLLKSQYSGMAALHSYVIYRNKRILVDKTGGFLVIQYKSCICIHIGMGC